MDDSSGPDPPAHPATVLDFESGDLRLAVIQYPLLELDHCAGGTVLIQISGSVLLLESSA